MDKEQQKRVPQGDKSSHAKSKPSSSSTTTTTPATTAATPTAQQRVKSWGSSSKFNKILSNLERSILNQFHHGSGGASGGSSNSNSSSSSSTSLIKTKGGQATKMGSLSIGPPNPISTQSQISSLSSPSNDVNLQLERCGGGGGGSDKNNKRCNGQQVQNDSAPSKGITLQLKSEPTRVKTALNKYQQQIVSTMRPNHQSILNSGGSGCNNNNIIINNNNSNKLSIPPPHANDEARSQNHRIIFGASAMPNSKLSSDSIVVGSSATLRPSASNRLVSITSNNDNTARGSASNKQNDPQNIAETNLNRNNASPASSAKSLPTIATKQIGSQTFNKSINEDEEESGFSTYQSRRSLFADNNTKTNTPTNITTTSQAATTTTSTGGHNQSHNCNNMIIMQTQTQVPIGAMNFNNNLATSQQLVYNYQFPQLSQPQQQTMNTHQLVANNQVPIPSTTTATTIDQSNKKCYPIQASQLHYLHSNTLRPSQNQFSDHQNPHKNTQFPPQQSHQLYNLYALNSGPMQAQVPQQADNNGQEIYANAPPKPRRYQYYDSANTAHLFPPQMIATMTAATSSAMTTSTISMANGSSNNGIGHHHQQQQQQHPVFNRQNFSQSSNQQQIPYNQPIYNISYLQVPNLYQQGLPVQVNNRQQQISYNINPDNHQDQSRPLNLPYTLTKSKSSLDACDLIQYKLDAQNRSNTLRLNPQHRQHHVQLQQQQQMQQQQSIYESRLDSLNHYTNTMQGQQPGMQQFFGNNLQRSKSVSHLLQPDYERQQMNQQHQQSFIHNGHATINPKYYSVSSASTTNLNSVGLQSSTNNNQQISQQNQFSKISSHLNNSHNQPPQQQYHDLVQKQGNQLFSATAQRQHPLRPNNWQRLGLAQQNQVSLNCNELSNQQQNRAPNPVNAAKTNVAFPNCNTKIIRQPQSLGDKFILEDGFGKPSLDDKIRYLMTGDDDSIAAANVMVKNSNHNDLVTSNSNNASLPQTAWSAQQQQVSVPAEPSIANCNSILKRENNVGRQNVFINDNNNNSNHSLRVGAAGGANAQRNLDDPALTNRIYIDDLASNMGNRQQRQYQVNDMNHLDSTTSQLNRNNGNSESLRIGKNSANSHLIVDLTTPRVLAKTQTTLSSGDIHADVMQRRDSCSINQVGLPQQPVDSMANVSHGAHRPLITPDHHNVMQQNQHQQQQQKSTKAASVSDPNKNDSSSTNKSNFSYRPAGTGGQICERTAPYYYSDLKSKEQRQALLSIVQHKSLSPPPQLLSRSTDQSSTRLALKSATLHPGHLRSSAAQSTNDSKNLKHHLPNNDFISTTNISKNIDKLFESPAQPRINAVQSMLALNDYVENNSQISQLSNFPATSESTSVGYFSGDMKKNFSKSKSLDNINQGFNNEIVIDGPIIGVKRAGNPVYENICRSDKLMSAINNSTTCLSTSTSRSNNINNNRKVVKYIVDSHQNFNSEESTDSILGSSLDESDSSLDLIDEINISPSDNHLSDISQLIEQLKINHSKLSEEYRSTMARIAKTINTKNKQTSADHKSDKLSRRLQLLELKSKKCESRGKNQLALIQMMEKVLQQSKFRTSTVPLLDNNSLTGSTDSSKPSIVNRDERISTSPSLSFDYQNLKQSVQAAYTSPTSSNSPSTLNSQHSQTSDTMRKFNDQPSISSSLGNGVIKAIVTETESPHAKFVSEVKSQGEVVSGGQVSLSTRHHQQSLQQGAFGLKATLQRNSGPQANQTAAVASSVEMRNYKLTKNPFSNNNDGEEEEEEDSSSSSESSVEEVRGGVNQKLSRKSESNGTAIVDNSSNVGLDMTQDEEDFIEFLTTDTSDHGSQFGASQFSASDFNSQASTGGDSNSRQVNNKSNSNNSYASKNHLFPNNSGAMNTTGILKSAKNGYSCSKNTNNIYNNTNNNNNNINGTRNSNKGFNTDNLKGNLDGRSKFNNVLGNVIDVDICPMNRLSENSPVNNRASCLN